MLAVLARTAYTHPQYMTRQYLLALLAGLAVLLTSCDKPRPIAGPETPRDENLRRFLAINSLHATFELPADTKGYVPLVFVVVDGEIVDTATGVISGTGTHEASRRIECELLWRGKGYTTDSPFTDFILMTDGSTAPLHPLKGLPTQFTGRGNFALGEKDQFDFEGARVGAVLQLATGNTGMGHLDSEAQVRAEKGKAIVLLALAHGRDYDALTKRFGGFGR